MDYHLYPEEVHRLHDAFADLYSGYIRRARRESWHPTASGPATI